jgi:hypothetical protein
MFSARSATLRAGAAPAAWPTCRPDHGWAKPLASGAPFLVLGLTFIIAALLTLAPAMAAPQNREPVRAQVSVDVNDGFARLVFAYSDEVNSSVHGAGTILIVNFDRPVHLAVEPLVAHASNYIVAARRDPDGRSVRFALAQKVTVNSIEAADKFFVDLLPATWNGPPPPLPHEVVEDLAKRAREVEHLHHFAQLADQRRKATPVRLHVVSHPTFMRYVFDIPEQTSVSADRAKERLTLTFDTPLTFDMTEVETNLPPVVASINAETEQDLSLVRFSFMAPVDLRTFRDGTAYVVDVVKDEASSAAYDHARGKAIPQVNSNMEALPQLNVTAESMTVTPPARASAAAGPPAPPVERHAVTAEPVLAPPVAPAEQMQESTIAVQSNAAAPTPKLKESQSSAEFTPMADKADRPAEAKNQGRGQGRRRGRSEG